MAYDPLRCWAGIDAEARTKLDSWPARRYKISTVRKQQLARLLTNNGQQVEFDAKKSELVDRAVQLLDNLLQPGHNAEPAVKSRRGFVATLTILNIGVLLFLIFLNLPCN